MLAVDVTAVDVTAVDVTTCLVLLLLMLLRAQFLPKITEDSQVTSKDERVNLVFTHLSTANFDKIFGI